MNRVLLLVDAGYLVNLQKRTGKIDILKFKKSIEKQFGDIKRAYYFTSYDTPNQQSFHSWLKSSTGPKFEVIIKNQKQKTCESCGNVSYVEKGIDVAMSTTLIKLAHKDLYDTLVLVNGDADLLDALVYVRDDLNKEIVIAGEMDSISPNTQAISTSVYLLSDHIDEIRG